MYLRAFEVNRRFAYAGHDSGFLKIPDDDILQLSERMNG